MSAPEQPNWIERLRDVRLLPTASPDLDVAVSLWPLLCDVVEAAQPDRFYGSQAEGWHALHDAIAALRAEVERDA